MNVTTDQEVLPEDKRPISRDATEQAEAEQKALTDYAEAQLRKLSTS